MNRKTKEGAIDVASRDMTSESGVASGKPVGPWMGNRPEFFQKSDRIILNCSMYWSAIDHP